MIQYSTDETQFYSDSEITIIFQILGKTPALCPKLHR